MKTKIKTSIQILSIFFIVMLGKQEISSQDFKVVGYFPTYRFSLVDSVDFESLTHVNIAFAGPDDEGFLTANGIDISNVVEKAHAANLEVYISLAGGVAPIAVWNFWLGEDYRSFFIHNIITYLFQYNLQGVDVDLEWGNVNDDYSAFVLELRDSLDNYNLGLTAALPGTYRYPEISDQALNTYDWINLMVYDLRGPWNPDNPGPHSPYSFAIDAIQYWKGEGLSKEKMVLGVPFYGYDFSDPSNVHSVKFSEMVELDTAYAYLDQVGQIYYNGLNTIHAKTELAIAECSGIMMWELGQDDFGQFSLLQEISKTIDLLLYEKSTAHQYQDEMVIYPNPSDNFINIKSEEAIIQKIELYDMEGNKQFVSSLISANNFKCSLLNQATGMYFLYIWTDHGLWIRRIVKGGE